MTTVFWHPFHADPGGTFVPLPLVPGFSVADEPSEDELEAVGEPAKKRVRFANGDVADVEGVIVADELWVAIPATRADLVGAWA